MNRVLTVFCCFVLCSVPMLGQKKSSKSAMSDQQFVNFAAQTDMVDANLGQFARTAAPSQSVKDYAQKLATDQTNDFHDLSKVAQQSSLNVPNAIDKEHNRSIIDPFQKLNGTAFDHRFVAEMIAEDTKAIDVYKREAADAQTPALRSYAEEALPILRTDLAQAKKVEMTPSKKG
jgi:putative membrane protein